MSDLIEAGAPVVTRTQIEIAAPAEVVWAVLTAFERWPSWNPEVKSMSAPEPLAVGSTFRWKAGPGTITSRIEHLEPSRLIGWSGKTMGISAIDVFHLDASGQSTIVREEESWTGLVARVFRGPLQRSLDRSLQNGLQALKAAVEQR